MAGVHATLLRGAADDIAADAGADSENILRKEHVDIPATMAAGGFCCEGYCVTGYKLLAVSRSRYPLLFVSICCSNAIWLILALQISAVLFLIGREKGG